MEKQSMEEFFEQVITVKWGNNKRSVDIIDQTLLPGEMVRIQLCTREEIWEAIKKLRVRGAPAIGVCAAYGIAMEAAKIDADSHWEFYEKFHAIKEYLATSRPTAVNLFWALNRMEKLVKENPSQDIKAMKELLFLEAEKIRNEDVEISRSIGRYGFEILRSLQKEGRPVGILTHCNAGTLATAKYGTATAPMYIALEQGFAPEAMHVYCDETRPLLQGARLTALELSRSGIPTTLQCDNMASVLMGSGKIDVIFVGCDRVAANGDAANKIGTNTVAVLAKHYGIPFYVCAPSSTIDMSIETGAQIPIEMRDPMEIASMWYKTPMAPEGIDIFNPAFDVTDHSLITGMITERGICKGDFKKEFTKLGIC